ncbi:hypothetical protein TNCV_143341 [Trichonephila clavipes]|nr:hypothetical protein TNCV_143341 [Trichonephila clavipes]
MKYLNIIDSNSVIPSRPVPFDCVLLRQDFSKMQATPAMTGCFIIYNNNGNPQTVVVENQHINPPEEPELMANADSDAPKKPVNVFFFQFQTIA